MKLLTTLSFAIISIASFSQQAINWGPEITVSDGSQYGNFRPRATITGNDTPVVIYGRNGDGNIFISRWNGSAFDAPISIIPGNTSSYIASWTGPDIGSIGDTVIAVFKLNPLETGNVYSVRSTDGGLTFSDTIRVDSHDTGVAWMPSMDMDEFGNPVMTYMIHDAAWTNPRYAVTHSYDAGITYNGEFDIATSTPGEACDCCPAEMVVDGQKQVMLFRNNEANVRDIFGVLSTDGGLAFPSNANIDNNNWIISGCPATGPDGVFMGDNLLTTFTSAGGGISRVYVSSSSTTAGLVFDEIAMVPEPTPANGTQNYPRISGENDTVVLAWTENEGGNQEIYYSVSIPGYNPVSALTTYKYKGNLTTSGAQTNPEIIYKNGLVHLFYQDNSSGDVIYRRGTIDINVGIEEKSNVINVFPNPSLDGTFILEGIHSDDLSITDALGRSIDFKYYFESGNTILEFIDPVAGIYFLNNQSSNSITLTIQ